LWISLQIRDWHVEKAEEASTLPKVSKPAAQTRFVLDGIEELKATMLACAHAAAAASAG
jgi:hypothetical protein